MSSGRKARIDKLHSGAISTVSSEILITKNGKTLRQDKRGTNLNKVIRIVVRL